MALFTDGQINGLGDLQHYENSILEVASIEGLDTGAKMRMAQEEIGNRLLVFLLRYPGRDSRATVRRTIGLSDVVVTAPLQRWHALKTLALIYRDAYNNQLNDRYLGKRNEYEQLSEAAFTDYLQIGAGFVTDPLPKATSPAITNVAGTGNGGTYYVAVAWVNSAGQEGAPSDVSMAATSGGTQLMVSAENPPVNAVGWNVYVGPAPDGITLQNASPNSPGSTWVLPPGDPIQGAPPSGGQGPDRFVVQDRLLQRG